MSGSKGQCLRGDNRDQWQCNFTRRRLSMNQYWLAVGGPCCDLGIFYATSMEPKVQARAVQSIMYKVSRQ